MVSELELTQAEAANALLAKLAPSLREECAQIPPAILLEEEAAARSLAFDQLHAEAVAAGRLPAVPRTLFGGLFGKLLTLLLPGLIGVAIGMLCVAVGFQFVKANFS